MIREVRRKRVSARLKSESDNKGWRRWLILALVVIIGSSAGFFLWKNRARNIDTSAVSASFHRLTTWVAEHRHRLNDKVVKVKELATPKAEEPIHFEFYSELPNAIVPVPESNENNQKT